MKGAGKEGLRVGGWGRPRMGLGGAGVNNRVIG